MPTISDMTTSSIGTARRWSMLVIALTSTMFANVFINGAAFLIPTLHTERGLDLASAGLISSLPSFGMVATLIAWGYVVDRVGERIVLTAGSALTAAAAFGAASVDSLVAVGRLPVSRRHGGGEFERRQRPARGRVVPATPARTGDGNPPDGDAARRWPWRTGDSTDRGQWRRFGRTAVPGRRLRRLSGDMRCGRARSTPAAASGGACRTPRQPLPRVGNADTDPRPVSAARGAPGPGVDVQPGVVDLRPRMVRGVGGRAGQCRSAAGRRWPDRRRLLVGSRWVNACGPSGRSRRRRRSRWDCWP